MKILCIETNGFEDVEFAGTIGILRRGGCDIDIYSLHGTKAVGKWGLEVSSLKNIELLDVKNYDFLLITGGPQYFELENNRFFINIVKYFKESDKYIAAICAGPTILGHLGYLKNKKYTCFTSMNEDFGGTFIDDYVVEDAKIITAKSAAATLEFAFKILEVVKGKEVEKAVKEQIYYKK